MVRQINPSLARLWTNSNSKQYGAAGKIQLDDLTEAELRILDYLEHGVTESQFPQLTKITKSRPQQVESLLERLGPLVTKTSAFMAELDGIDVERQFSEIMRLYLLEHQDPKRALEIRASSRVFISSLNRTGLTILRGLSDSGVGKIFTTDQKTVSLADTLDLGFPTHLIGKQRVQAAKTLLPNTKVELHSRISQSFDRTELAILIHSDVTPPSSYAIWLSRDVPHMAITFTESGVELSHLVIPGITPCLACLEIDRLEQQQNWSRIAPQLQQLDRDLSDSSVSLFAASIALNHSLNLIDGFDFESQQLRTRMQRDGSLFQSELPKTNCGCRLVG